MGGSTCVAFSSSLAAPIVALASESSTAERMVTDRGGELG